MMWYWGSNVQWWGWALMVVGMVAFWGLLIWAVASLVGGVRAGSSWGGGQAGADPEQLLARRFASGEIDEDEYRRRLEILRHDHLVGGRT